MKNCTNCGKENIDVAKFCGNCGNPFAMPERKDPDLELLRRALQPKFIIEKQLGEGGMATVFLGEQVALERKVVIKLLKPEYSKDPGMRDRFFQEAKTGAKLKHQHIIEIIDVGLTEERPYFIMEFVPNGSLDDRLGEYKKQGKAFPVKEAVEMVLGVLRALEVAHAKDVIHRDIKPENILLRETWEPVVGDFGIAKVRGGAAKTQTGLTMGTVNYMSPEQCEGKSDLDGRSDLYSVGIMLYELLTGEVPFKGENAISIVNMHIHTKMPSLTNSLKAKPFQGMKIELKEYQAIEPFILKACEKDRNRRFANAGVMIEELKKILMGKKASQASFESPVRDQKKEEFDHSSSTNAPVAGATRRIFARLIDDFIVYMFVFSGLGILFKNISSSGGLNSGNLLLAVGFSFVYRLITFQAKKNTLGRKIMGIRTISDDGGEMPFKRILVYSFFSAILSLGMFLIFSILTPIVSLKPTWMIETIADFVGRRMWSLATLTFFVLNLFRLILFPKKWRRRTIHELFGRMVTVASSKDAVIEGSEKPEIEMKEKDPLRIISGNLEISGVKPRILARLIDDSIIAVLFFGGLFILVKDIRFEFLLITSVTLGVFLGFIYRFLFLKFINNTPGKKMIGNRGVPNYSSEMTTKRKLLYSLFSSLFTGGSLFLGIFLVSILFGKANYSQIVSFYPVLFASVALILLNLAGIFLYPELWKRKTVHELLTDMLTVDYPKELALQDKEAKNTNRSYLGEAKEYSFWKVLFGDWKTGGAFLAFLGLILVSYLFSKPKFDEVSDSETKGYRAVRIGKKWGVIDKEKNLVVPAIYDEKMYPSYQFMTKVKKDGKYGYIDHSKNQEIIPVLYEKLGDFNNDLAAAKQNGLYGYLNQKGDWAILPIYDNAYFFTEYVNGTEPKFIYAKVKKNGKLGMIGSNNLAIVPFLYDELGLFNDGLAKFELNRKYGYLDNSGKVVIPAKFELSFDFNHGLALFKENNLYGFIDKKGNVVIKPIFEDAHGFYDGKNAEVKYKGKKRYIDRTGKFVQ